MLKLATFKRGIHLPEYKKATRNLPITDLPLPRRLILPLKQNAGAPPRAVVEKGERVRKGQLLAEASAAISAPLHSPACGVIKSIGKFPHPAGPPSLAIEIETDPETGELDYLTTCPKPLSLSPEEIRNRVGAAGIVGMGGAGFPARVKLEPPPQADIEYAVINGAECEPFLTVDHRLMLEEPDRVLLGLEIIMKAVGAPRGVVAVEANKRDAYRVLREKCSGRDDIRAELVKVKYPQGAEKQLIYSLFHREVPPGGLPSQVGCVVQNVQTAAAIAAALIEGKPLIDRVITVAGPGVERPGNFRVAIGTLFSDIVVASGGLPQGNVKVISGGPMMGVAQATLEVPVIKGTSGILVMPPDERPRNLACIRCGECLRVCPMGLVPCELGRLAEKEDIEGFEKLRGKDCIECGCCAYVCSAGRDLVQFIQLGKSKS